MVRRTLNLGILAHVDAGKTTLTERLLYAAGVIDEPGSVDAGTTQTDFLALERRRGITIRSAVASFALDDVTVNLLDTPGHPDFIAEVERVLGVLDGAVLVVSAVEGVQAQTRVLMRALQRLAVPTVVFVNKIDRAGAGDERVLEALAERLSASVVAMGSVRRIGTRAATFRPFAEADTDFLDAIAERDDDLLAAYVDGGLPYSRLRQALARQTRQGLVHPVYFGSALTGAGVDALAAGVAELLPPPPGEPDGPLAGTVFKVERGPAGEKIAYVRMFSGTLRTRDRVGEEQKVTALTVFDRGADEQAPSASAGQIAKLWGLSEVQVGDAIGERRSRGEHHFAPPTLESVVVPRDPRAGAELRAALGQLAEQDPLIDVRQDREELSVSLYGEVQKEVIEATLATDYGLEVDFRETTTICVERPAGAGEAAELLHAESNPYNAAMALRVEPGPEGSGIDFRLDVDARTMPLFVYKTADAFAESMEAYVGEALRNGPAGWRVTDCVVTMTGCTYSVPDGPPSRRGPLSTAADFRKLTPLVVAQALEAAGTVVCEPLVRGSLEVPADTIGAVLPALTRIGASVEPPSPRGRLALVDAVFPAARADELRRRLPGLTRGEGVLECVFDRYAPVAGRPGHCDPRDDRLRSSERQPQEGE